MLSYRCTDTRYTNVFGKIWDRKMSSFLPNSYRASEISPREFSPIVTFSSWHHLVSLLQHTTIYRKNRANTRKICLAYTARKSASPDISREGACSFPTSSDFLSATPKGINNITDRNTFLKWKTQINVNMLHHITKITVKRLRCVGIIAQMEKLYIQKIK